MYLETGWETLAERRRIEELTLINKMINKESPDYLTEMLPNTVGYNNRHNHRNSSDLVISFSR